MTELRRLEFFELVLPRCTRTYGSSPCTAAIGTTGDYKCYNSPATCQDHANYEAGEQVVRWAVPTEDLPVDYDYIPSIINTTQRAQEIKPGESLGTRESFTVSFFDHAHNDVIFDPYIDDREFNPYVVGSFWPKFAARWPNIQGYEGRYVRGVVGQPIETMQRFYYAVESTSGPDSSNGYSITCKDALKFLDNDKAVCPLPSSGVLLGTLTDVGTSLTLSPTGIGDAEYPTSGTASIGDEEVRFTRVADVVTLTERGVNGSQQGEHNEGETFQLAEVFESAETSDIIERLITGFTDTPAEYVDLVGWQAETVTHIGRLYNAEIMKPTGVKKLIDELIEQVGLVVYTDTQAKKFRVKAMRNLVPLMSITDDLIIDNSITAKTESDKRISAVMTFYAQKNPLENIDQEKNYNATKYTINSDPVAALENSPFSIKKIFSRWINVFSRAAAEALNNSLIYRYGRAPRSVGFKLPAGLELEPGSVFTLQSYKFCDSQGFPAPPIRFQAVSVEVGELGCTVMGESIPADLAAPEEGVFRVYIDTDSYNLNLRSVFDSVYVAPEEGDEVQFIFSSNVKVGSLSTSSFAIQVGTWPTGVILKLIGNNTNRIQGRGGDGAKDYPAQNGGPSLYTRFDIEVIGDFKIFSGGGGGGTYNNGFENVQGGGGAGFVPGYPAATVDSGGYATGLASAGGDPGLDGEDVPAGTNGGIAGVAIDGVSFITFTGTPDIRGPQIN